jgi:stress response protein SCP2/very-short-patch-repair endonuclease
MQIDKGRRIKISDLFTGDTRFEMELSVTGPGLAIDFACFGLDAAGKLSDERYMTFFNQPKTPCGGVAIAPGLDGAACLTFDLDLLPASIERMVLTAAIDGSGSMSQLSAGHVRILRDGQEAAKFAFAGTDFDSERALMLAEIYRKDGAWRFGATGQGFNGGMDALVTHFGAAVSADLGVAPSSDRSEKSPSPSPSPTLEAHASVMDIQIVADRTIGYAAIQNNVPVVRSITLLNKGAEPLVDVEIVIRCSPGFAVGARLKFERLIPGESRKISPIDLQPDHEYLSALDELELASINVTATSHGRHLVEVRHAIDVLAYDQWAGTRSLPELLAAFCMPNSRVVDHLIARASALLRGTALDSSMSGYQAKNREKVWQQVSALYSTLVAEDLQYSNPPASFGADGQKIRTPERIMDGRIATCLDLAMLFASCLEQAGLHPVVLFKEGHAWVGVWLIETCFSTALVDDVQAVRKRVKSGEFIVFETTGVAGGQKPSLRWACSTGEEHLNEETSFHYAIDIRRARELQIRPLPSRSKPGDLPVTIAAAVGPSIEEMPTLPPLDPAFLPVTESDVPDTPEGRLAKWKSKLLDLTLRNRLLNFKPVKTTLRVICPDPGALEDILSEGKEFKIRALLPVMTGGDSREAAVFTARNGTSPLDVFAQDALGRREIIVDVAEDALDARLLEIFRAAGTGLEEGGANTLFLAFGLLQWQEEKDAEARHLAPILLIPVTLSRQSVRSGFRLTRHDDEALVNPTLVQKLWQDFSLKLPSFDILPTDDKGLDVGKILQIFRLHVTELKGWEVKDQVHLGIFSFTKFLMWKDLQDRHKQLLENSVVAHLINNPGKAFAESDIGFAPATLDDTHRPQDLFAPMLSDSSQLRAICVASAGKNLVIEGPPGTGKSQTISNLIAHLLATGKTVLFVSEKMAALEVVHRRLNSLGLGAFCLELHSSKAKKSTVLKQLGTALEAAGTRTVKDWEMEAERLAVLRQELNGVARALHRLHPNDLTIYDAIGLCIKHNDKRPAAMDWSDANVHSRTDLETLREISRQMAALAGQLSSLRVHPLSEIAKTNWTPTWQQELLDSAASLAKAASSMQDIATPALTLFGLQDIGLSLADLAAFDRLADVLICAPQIPVGIAKVAHDESARAKLAFLRQHGVERQKIWEPLSVAYREEVATLGATELKLQWAEARATWWPRNWFSKRAVANRLRLFKNDMRRPVEVDIAPFLESLGKLNVEDKIFESMAAEASALLQEGFAAHKTDWAAVEVSERWARDFSDAVTKMAGSDAELVQKLRLKLQLFVTDNRAALKPDGAVGAMLIQYRDAFRVFIRQLGNVAELGGCAESLGQDQTAPGAVTRLLGITQGWQVAARQLQPWCLWQRVRAKAIGHGLHGLVNSLETAEIALAEIPEFFEYSYQSWWVKKTIDREPVLCAFSSADHERKIGEFRLADARFQKLTQQYIVAKLSGQIPSSAGIVPGADSEMGKLRRELQKQRKHMPIRQLVQSLPTLMPKLKPCLLMSPLSVSQYLDAAHAQFDVVIFDEASQIPVWDAVGAIARGRQLTCVGDPKQLPPTNFFNRVDDSEDGVGDDDVQDLESILDECLSIGMPKLSLNWHYRSRHESLITFSNVTYYENKLVTFPSPVTHDKGVRFEHVRGVYDRGGSRTNRAEADAIVKSIEIHYLDPSRRALTLGVVTFNQAQQSLIERLLDERRRASAQLDQAIAQAADEPLFIKNLENVQGDERDIIYFSITYGPDAAGKVNLNFGPLNLEGGHRRLNVAVSRARQGVVVFSTLLPEQIDLSRVRAAGVRDLKNYLEFAIRGPRALVEQITPTSLEPDSPFELEVISVLRQKGWTVHPQVGVSAYRIDIGVVDPRAPGRYLLGVECDGRTYHSGATARDRDRLRQHVLEGLGWELHRIWSTDWWLNPQEPMRKLLARLEQLVTQEPDSSETEGRIENAPGVADAEEEAQLGQYAELVEAEGVAAGPALNQYQVTPQFQGAPGQFYEAASVPDLRTQVLSIVNSEGPVADFIVFRRIARAWGLSRTGRRIEELLNDLVPGHIACTSDGTKFYWPEGSEPSSWDGFRTPSDDAESKRLTEEICVEELGNVALFVLSEHGSTSREDLARSVCRLLGIARTTAESEERIYKALTHGRASARIKVENGLVTVCRI